ncbi:MAG TPA: hypothetical protein ENI99_10990 [Sedimenticola sp.]|nr:hypothetical protein [Sedimenticola sp.]
MTNAIREQISALLDSELSRGELNHTVDQLYSREELRGTWDRYNLISDVIRGEAADRARPSVADRVRAQLESEPAILAAPKPGKIPTNWVRPVAGTALAASVAAVAILVAPQILNKGGDAAPQVTAKTLPSLNRTLSTPSPAPHRFVTAKSHVTRPAPGTVMPSATTLYLRRSTTRWKNLPKPAVASKLNKYLLEHGEYAVQGGMKSVLPYATFVGYDAER